jgi:aerobic carbon-monoxide dehydrogenase medium subunit
VKPAPFTYHQPATLPEAVALLAELAPRDGRVLAGGQSLVPIMAFRLARPAHLVDINGVAGLDRLAVDGGSLRIGALVRHARLQRPVADGPLGALLAAVVRHVAHYPIRARGTFCGSSAHADPASEWCAVAAGLDAEMVAESKVSGTRVIPARTFFEGIMTTALHEDELLREVRLPILPKGTFVGFAEYSRRAGDYAIAMAVASYRLKNGIMSDMHIAVGGAEAMPRRIPEAERTLIGRAPNLGTFQAAAHEARKAVDPLDDPSVPADYRRGVVRAMVTRALEGATS